MVEVDAAALEGGAVVAAGPFHIVHMSAVEVGAQAVQVLAVVEQEEVVLALDVAEIVPVHHMRIIGKFGHEPGHFPFSRHLFKMAAALYSQHQVVFLGFFCQGVQGFEGAFVVERGLLAAAAHQFTFAEGVFLAVYPFVAQLALQFARGAGGQHELYAPHVQYDIPGFKTGCHLECFEGEPQGSFPRFRAVRGEGEGIRRVAGHFDGGGAEIVHACHFDTPAVHGFDDARQFAEAQPVRGFDIFEAQFADFIADGTAILMPAAVPAGGKNVHGGIVVTIWCGFKPVVDFSVFCAYNPARERLPTEETGIQAALPG